MLGCSRRATWQKCSGSPFVLGGSYTGCMASRICWQCQILAHMTRVLDARYSPDGHWYAVFRCANCEALSIAYHQDAFVGSSNGNQFFENEDNDFYWLPREREYREFEDVPEPINSAASEAFSCHSIGAHRAAILMARAVVEAIAKDRGITKGSLHSKIEAMVDSGVLTASYGATAHEIRFLGNEMAHGDFVTDVTESESSDVLSFMESLLVAVYQLPARLNRFRSSRGSSS